ncbi:MAG: rod shape-determining protein MreC [Deltaproteobacteria bacterium]|nr:rod shape-determining protein MreC [Deltaproteobacteria bacterium]
MRSSERQIFSFLKRYQIILVSAALALFSLHLALTDKKEYARGYLLKEILSYTVTPVQSAILGVQGSIKGVWTDYFYLVGVKDENEALKKTVYSLVEENRRLSEETKQNERLRALLEFKEALPYSTIGSAITGYSMERWSRTIVIDKGSSNGIEKDHGAIALTGVVGRVVEVNGASSRVLLTTDLRSNIDVIIERTRVKGVVEGNGTDGLVMKYVRQVDDVKPGDIVVTSGLSGVFPKGLAVGEVIRVEKSGDNFFKHIEVRPAVDLGRLEEVLVLKENSFHEK